MARLRALYALGSFHTEESKNALKSALAQAELQCVAHAALYALDNKQIHVRFVIDNEELENRRVALWYLSSAGCQEAGEVLDELKDKK